MERLQLEILKEQEIDVMFTDIRMPKMDGIELDTENAEPRTYSTYRGNQWL